MRSEVYNYSMKLKHNIKKPLIAVSVLLIAAGMAFAAKKVSEERQKLITTSLGYVGVPYIYGADDWEIYKGFDCSGFVDYVFRKALNINLPRTAQAIYERCTPVNSSNWEPGDLLFYKNDPNGKITHVGIYLGVYHGELTRFEGKRVFVSAVSDGPETGVVISEIDQKFWKNHYYAAGRILPPSE